MALKVAVYAIAFNESHLVDQWVATTQGADLRVVTDTGSSDDTVEALTQKGVTVYQTIVDPWRFDTARNASLQNVPLSIDVCISLDMDEQLTSGWRAELEALWTPDTTMIRYPAIQKWDGRTTQAAQVIYGFKIHSRKNYYWKYGIHECLVTDFPEKHVWTEKIQVLQPRISEKTRPAHTKLFEELANEDPNEPRYAFYLGREYYSCAFFEKAYKELQRFIEISKPSEHQLRCLAFGYLSDCAWRLGATPDTYLSYLWNATASYPFAREPWAALARGMERVENWPNCFSATVNALSIKDPRQSLFMEGNSWDGSIEALFTKSAMALKIPKDEQEKIMKQLGGHRMSFESGKLDMLPFSL